MPKAKKKSEELRLSIELPMKGHTGTSLRNLVNLMYATGRLAYQINWWQVCDQPLLSIGTSEGREHKLDD